MIPAGALNHTVSNNCAATNITTAAWVELEDLMPDHTSYAYIYNGSSQVLKLAINAAGSETEIPLLIGIGMNQVIPMTLSAGQRLAVRAVSANATTGFLTISFFRR